MLFACGFLAVQRFTISPINTFICAVPLGLFVLQMLRGNHQTGLTCLVLALFLSCDNGAGTYAETVTPLRHLISIFAIGMLFYLSNWRIQRRPLILALLLGCGVAYGSVTSAITSAPIDITTLRRDLLVLVILSAFLMDRSSARLDLHLLFSGSLGYLIGEVLNASILYKDYTQYLSYESLKAFVIFPIFYILLTRKNIAIQIFVAVATFYVILLYGTRMITLSIILLIGVALTMNMIRKGRSKSLLVFIIAVSALANINLAEFLADTDFIQFKALSFLVQIQQHFVASDISLVLEILDPVRFAEHQLFFDRPILEVIFGSGLGSGIQDASGELAFVTFDQTAFSEQEINSSTFFNLHDFWIDFGLRFGLLSVTYFIYQIVFKEMQHGRLWHGVLFGILIINTTFATSGLLLTALLVRFLPRPLEK